MGDDTEWEEIDATEDSMFWNPIEPGECIEGRFNGMAEGEYGEYGLLDVGGFMKGLPRHKNLMAALKNVDEGDFIRICLTELQTIDGLDNPKRIYRVFRKK